MVGTNCIKPSTVLIAIRDLYLWAATVLTSRCFPSSALQNSDLIAKKLSCLPWNPSLTFPVLLPVFDLANHDPMAKVTWNWGSSHCALSIDYAIASGRQVFNNYGWKGNEECQC